MKLWVFFFNTGRAWKIMDVLSFCNMLFVPNGSVRIWVYIYKAGPPDYDVPHNFIIFLQELCRVRVYASQYGLHLFHTFTRTEFLHLINETSGDILVLVKTELSINDCVKNDTWSIAPRLYSLVAWDNHMRLFAHWQFYQYLLIRIRVLILQHVF